MRREDGVRAGRNRPGSSGRMVAHALAGVLLAGWLWVGGPPDARGASPHVMVSGADSLAIWVLVQWDSPLPRFVEERLAQGIPATVGLRADLVADRSGWFDRRVAQHGLEWKVARDPWGESYLLLDSAHVASYDSLPALREALSRQRLRLPVHRGWCDDATDYRLELTAYVLPLSSRDAGEVESWLKGQIRGLGRGVLGLPRGLFAIVRDISGLGERASKGKSGRFRMAALPDGKVRVVIGGSAAPVAPALEP